jgi:hypothetical protein
VAFFSSCPAYNLRVSLSTKSGLKFRKLRGRISMVAEGAKSIFDECQTIVRSSKKLDDIDLVSSNVQLAIEYLFYLLHFLHQDFKATIKISVSKFYKIELWIFIGLIGTFKVQLLKTLIFSRICSTTIEPCAKFQYLILIFDM